MVMFSRSFPTMNGFLHGCGQGQFFRWDVAANGAASTDGRIFANGNWSDQLCVGADVNTIFNDSMVFVGAVVVAGDGASPNIDLST